MMKFPNIRYNTREQITAFFFVLPWLAGFLLFTVGPMVASLYYSFTEYNVIQPPVWIGLQNYVKMFQDEIFWQSLRVTLKFAIFALPLNLIIGYLLAVLLNQDIPSVNLWRTLYYLPSVISGVAVAILWMRIFNPRLGWLNFFLESIHIDGPGWLQDPQWAVPALIIMSLWSVGGTMIIYLAGLQSVPTPLYDAAKMDGANYIQEFWHITLPMTSSVIFFNLIMGLISAFQYFTVAYTTSGGTGGPARSTMFYNLYLYLNAFAFSNMGYASAMAWILFIVVLGITLLVFRSSLFWVYYEGQARN